MTECGCGRRTFDVSDPPTCHRCREREIRRQKVRKTKHADGLATDEEIAEKARRAELELPLFDGCALPPDPEGDEFLGIRTKGSRRSDGYCHTHCPTLKGA